MKQNAQEGKSLLNFKILEAKRKPLSLQVQKKLHMENWKSIGNQNSQKQH